MDLKAILARKEEARLAALAALPVEQPKPAPRPKVVKITEDVEPKQIVHTANEPQAPYAAHLVCICSHPLDAHEENGACEILECECEGFVSAAPEAVSTTVETASKPFVVPANTARPEPTPTVVPLPSASTEVPTADLPEPSKECMPDGFCAHLCECGKWWTHGAWNKCRFPDLLKQGKCQACLNVGAEGAATYEPFDPLDGYVNNGEKQKLTPAAQIKIANDELVVCKNMSVEQLTCHIELFHKRIEELRVRVVQARQIRQEREDEELEGVAEENREKYRQELRRGAGATTTRKPRVKKDKEEGDGQRLSKQERTILNLMKSLGKTRAEVEALLND